MNNLFWVFYDWCSSKSDRIKKSVIDNLESIRFRFVKPQFREIVVSNVVQNQNSTPKNDAFRYISIQAWGYARLYVDKTKISIKGEQTVILKVPVYTPISICLRNIVGSVYASKSHMHPMLSKIVRQDGPFLIFSDETVFCDEIKDLPKNSLEEQFEDLIECDPLSIYTQFEQRLNQKQKESIPKQSADQFFLIYQKLNQKLKSFKIPYSIVNQDFKNKMKEEKL